MIKSFTIDHTKMKAPNIRLADTYQKGDIKVEKYDIRIVTPNTTYIDDKAMHSMEHLMATAFKREFKEDMIDLSPMGCKTGFYFVVFETNNTKERIKKAITRSSKEIIPKPTAKNCGSYELHDIKNARIKLKELAIKIGE